MNTPALALCCAVVLLAASSFAADPDRKKLVSNADRSFRQKEYNDAIRLYSQALFIEKDAKVHYKRYKAHLSLQDFENALSDLDSALELDPTYMAAMLQRGNLRLLTGRCAQAAEDYQAVLSIDPNKRDAVKRLPEAKACAIHLEQADGAFQRKQWSHARHLYEEASKPGRATASTPIMLKAARCSLEMRQYDDVIKDTSLALKLNNKDMHLLELRARAFYYKGDHEAAKKYYAQGLRLDPENKRFKSLHRSLKNMMKRFTNAESEQNSGNHGEAVKMFEELERMDPHHDEFIKLVLVKAAKSYTALKDFDAAHIACSKAETIEPNMLDALLCLGDVAMAKEEFEEAVRIFRRAVDSSNRDPRAEEAFKKAEVALKQSKTKNYYKILGVSRTASLREIKKAYRMLALEKHPDKVEASEREAAEKEFHDIAEAYEVLTDDEKRARYDRGEDVDPPPQGHHGGPFRHHGGGGHHFHFRFHQEAC